MGHAAALGFGPLSVDGPSASAVAASDRARNLHIDREDTRQYKNMVVKIRFW